jgi:membrane fusion protein, multidrug efflux system
MESENPVGAAAPLSEPPLDEALPTKTSRQWVLRRALIGAVILAIVVLIVYQSVTFLKQPQQRRGRFADSGTQPVGVARIRRGDIRLSLRALGAVTPLTTVTVNTQINGQLMSVGFKEGQLVRKGQFLAQIDPRPYQVALEQAQAQLVRDDATLKQAQMDLTRYQTLSQQVSIPRQTYEDQVWIVKQDQGTVDYDKAQIKAQQLNLIYCHIVAPSDGRVGLRLVDPGNYVQTSSTTGLVVLTLLNPTTVEFSVPEDSLPPIMARVRAGAKIPVTAFDRANVAQLAVGEFAAIDTQVNTTTGTVMLRAVFDNADQSLFPSQFVNVVMLLDTLKSVVTVPVAAVQRGAPGTYVYLVNENNTVSVHAIKLGAQDGDLFAVESGLSPGDRVVTDGADRLRDGAKVSIPDAAASPGAGGGKGAGRERGAPGGDDSGSTDRPNRQHRHRPQQQGDAQPRGDSQSPQENKP